MGKDSVIISDSLVCVTCLQPGALDVALPSSLVALAVDGGWGMGLRMCRDS